MDVGTMVASTFLTRSEICQPAQCHYELQTEPRWKCNTGTMEEPTLDIPSSNSPFLNELLEKAFEHIAPNSAYEKRLQNLWNEFVIFCKTHDLPLYPAHPKSIMSFLVWVDILSRSMKPRMYLTAISRFHQKMGYPNPTTDFNVQMLARNLMKLAATDHEAAWPRDPLPVEALRNYVNYPPANISTLIWKWNCAMIALGLRTMRRPAELCNLRIGDLKIENKICWVRINKLKTDQFAKGKFIPIEPTKSPYCPVRLVYEYLQERKWSGRNEDPLFLSVSGKRMTTGAVNATVKRIAQHARLEGKYSGHSIRIGGATGAMKARLTLPQIMSIGGWLSQSVSLYLRSVSTALQNTSTRMGF